MFQPEVKLEFVSRYCHPADGWNVLVDIDPSELGRTGGKRTTDEASTSQKKMLKDGETACRELQRIGVQVGGNRRVWYREHELNLIEGDRDIIAFNTRKRLHLIAEVEGESSGQPEQRLYKAIGQIVKAASEDIPDGWKRKLVLVVHGKKISRHLAHMRALEKLEISGIELSDNKNEDVWLFGEPLMAAATRELRK
jgi:hypothetical protein